MNWHATHRRDFPWRESRDPYQLIVTELMLVRTRASQVAKLWGAFFEHFPDLQALGSARYEDIQAALRPLGLEWRALRIADFAREACSRGLDDRLGETLLALPGIGPYVQAAVVVGIRQAGPLPVDVTIARVISRYAGLSQVTEPRRDPRVRSWTGELGVVEREVFHAFLDLAAEVCTPRRPACGSCPLRPDCVGAASFMSAVATSSSSSQSSPSSKASVSR